MSGWLWRGSTPTAPAPAAGAPPPAAAGQPLMLVSVDAAGRFTLNPPALSALRAIRGPVGVVTIGGRARQGKSMILNHLLQVGSGPGAPRFSVSSSTRPHTKGIWLWSAPVPAVGPDGKPYSLILMDSEGIDAVDQVRARDTERRRAGRRGAGMRTRLEAGGGGVRARPTSSHTTILSPVLFPLQTGKYSASIFSLSILLSSLFVYNQLGSLDEAALEKLALVVELTKSIQVKAGEGGAPSTPADPSALADAMPSFLWLLRDFYLDLRDGGGAGGGAGGGPGSDATDYMEHALADVAAADGGTAGKNGVRRAIRALFPRRACVALVRPAADEATLQRLEAVPLADLRPEFVAGLRALTAQIFALARPKRVGPGAPALTGPGLAALAAAYVAALNGGAVPVIATAWEGVAEGECRRAADAAEGAYRGAWGKADGHAAAIPDTPAALDAEHARCLAAGAEAFEEVALGEGEVRSAADGRWRAAAAREFASHRASRLAAASVAVQAALAMEGAAIAAWAATDPAASADGVAARISRASGAVAGVGGEGEPAALYGRWAATTSATAMKSLIARAEAASAARVEAGAAAVAAAEAHAAAAEARARDADARAAAGAGGEARATAAEARAAAAEARARDADARAAAAEASKAYHLTRAREEEGRAAADAAAAIAGATSAVEARAAAAERAVAAARTELEAVRAQAAAAAAQAAAAAAARAAPPPVDPPPPPLMDPHTEFEDAHAGQDVDPASMSIPSLKAWLTEAGHEDVAWRLAGARAKKADYVAAANDVLGKR
jgi:hypothetical protein